MSNTQDIAHEIWAAAQTAPGEGIEDADSRIEAILARLGTLQSVVRDPLSDGQIANATGAKIGTPLFLAAKGFVLATEAAHGITQKGANNVPST